LIEASERCLRTRFPAAPYRFLAAISIVVVSPATGLTEAASLMIQYRIGSLPVVEGDHLVRIISVTDLPKLFVEQKERGSDRKPSVL
jgi:predicted transcriptional regulator